MTISKAQPGDEYEIFSLAKDYVFALNREDQDKTGFIIYPKSPEKFLERINLCQHFYVAKNGGKILGYILLNNLDELFSLQEEIPYLDKLKEASNHEKLIYLDHLVVSKKDSGKGIGQKLYEYALEHLEDSYLTGFIVHLPIKNQRSFDFFVEKNHWQLIEEVSIDDFLCGLYGYQLLK